MTAASGNKVASNRVDWRALWASGDLARFCFVSLGILLHATNETMVATVMPAMVGELAGVQLVGWSLAIYELGAIVAGAAAGRLVAGIAGFVSVERLFPRNIWPQLFGIMSAIWGVAAFSGPMLGALMTEFLSWRWAFGVFTFGGAAMALASFVVLDTPEARKPQASGGKAPPFPYPALAVLALSVVLIAAAGVDIALLRSSLLLFLGVTGLALFFRVDALRPQSRLFPSPLFSWRSPLGSSMTMVAAFSMATCTFTIYGPLLLTTLHGIPILTTGYIIAAESIAWSILSILIANAPLERERLIIVVGALMIASGLAGFAYTIPAGSIPLILLCALLQGGGFGVCWPFLTRVIVASARDGEQTIASAAVPTMQRIGYAVGAALAGIVANASGFSEGLNREAAAGVAGWLFMAFVPLGVFGCLAALRIFSAANRPRLAAG
ncbi:MFS transporter [Mesorhizobium sp. CA4]|uniref:MFS transporter n=1 Tax=Mesorhizobium sp. CA4 TaxID=588499 RepID=UPI001CD120AB|nr:MFS transporter [Mesorhizobium sp. CA4]MBZ9821846.1 MFS transporter [Mesorhizobium sp. CA4]